MLVLRLILLRRTIKTIIDYTLAKCFVILHDETTYLVICLGTLLISVRWRDKLEGQNALWLVN